MRERFLLDLAFALHRFGLPSHRLEDSLLRVASHLGVELQVFTLPTGLQLGFGPLDEQRLRLLRVQPAGVNLARVAELNDLIEDLVGGGLDLGGARARLAEIAAAHSPHPPWLLPIAYGVVSGASAVFFGAHALEVAVSTGIGILVGLLSRASQHSERLARTFDVLAAALAAFLAGLLARLPWSLSPELVVLSSLVVLLPGYTFTIALNELTARHLAAGTARLHGAFVTFLLLGCGTALGTLAAQGLGERLPAPPLAAWAPLELPPGATWVALLLAPLAFQVLFQARHRDLPYIVGACVLAFLGARLGARELGPLLGTGLGALVLGLGSNVLARRRRQSTSVTQVPGLLILVPGSIGFRSLSSFLELDTLSGVELVFRTFAVAIALVAGLVLANVILPTRKSL